MHDCSERQLPDNTHLKRPPPDKSPLVTDSARLEPLLTAGQPVTSACPRTLPEMSSGDLVQVIVLSVEFAPFDNGSASILVCHSSSVDPPQYLSTTSLFMESTAI